MLYKTFNETLLNDIKAIYKQENWNAYLKDDQKLSNAFKNSLYVYGAFDDDQLVGFIRCVGDGEHVLIIQDLIVHKNYQKQGIGTTLFHHTLEKYKDVRTIAVFTDAYDLVDNHFYQKMGLKLIIENDMVAYMK